MKEIFKFINIQSISGESEKPLFFRKSFEDGKDGEIQEWYRKLCTLNIPKNYSRRFPKAEFNEFLQAMGLQLELRINNKNFIMEIYENKRYKFIVSGNRGDKKVEINFQGVVEKISSKNRVGYKEFILYMK